MVVNIHKDKYEIYIGRAGKSQDGYWGNPVAVGKPCPECSTIHKDGGSTLPCYKRWLKRKLDTDKEFRAKLLTLENKVLGCFCKPNPCHGDVLESAIAWLKTNPYSE